MAPKVPTSDTGTTTLGISAARALRRNRNTTITTSPTATISVCSTSASEARMVVVRSLETDRSMSAGMEARSSGSMAFTRSTVSMMFAPGWRFRISRTEGLPLVMPALRRSSTPSDTSATSDRRTAAPLR